VWRRIDPVGKPPASPDEGSDPEPVIPGVDEGLEGVEDNGFVNGFDPIEQPRVEQQAVPADTRGEAVDGAQPRRRASCCGGRGSRAEDHGEA